MLVKLAVYPVFATGIFDIISVLYDGIYWIANVFPRVTLFYTICKLYCLVDIYILLHAMYRRHFE